MSNTVCSLPWAFGWFRRDAHRPPAYLNILLTLLAVVHGSLVLRDVMANGPALIGMPWLSVGDLNLEISFSLSLTNVSALELITGLSLLSQIYSLGYLDKEWALARFFALLGFFEGAMSGVVLSDSLFQSYFLLEMLTLSTYLLVGFWYAQPLVVTAARDAFLTKRGGEGFGGLGRPTHNGNDRRFRHTRIESEALEFIAEIRGVVPQPLVVFWFFLQDLNGRPLGCGDPRRLRAGKQPRPGVVERMLAAEL